METAFTPLTFHRFNRPLRAVLIDGQPWFAAKDFGLLMGHRHPERICRYVDDDQLRSVRFALANGGEEAVPVISESGAYRALWRFNHPEHRNLRRWLTQEVVPLLRDEQALPAMAPRRTLMTWEARRVSLLEWQGELWVPLKALPELVSEGAVPRRGRLGRWLR
ncbi:BRO-N domain-containing protein [Pseudomonas indica]|jgi:prophage antirepressor-like protein|uniref:Prophage antirepressor n=1 Tax=Pseudomonas indica TaxID=137658 RepID=A0A1G9FKY5_9PSED|nr:BRO family protein [Pseudomonas indica]SDK89029.1 Prophage antirepressor [Pseudomonas indica]